MAGPISLSQLLGCRSALEGEWRGSGSCKEPRWDGYSQTSNLLAEALPDLITSASTIAVAKQIESVSIQILVMSFRALLQQKQAVLKARNIFPEG